MKTKEAKKKEVKAIFLIANLIISIIAISFILSVEFVSGESFAQYLLENGWTDEGESCWDGQATKKCFICIISCRGIYS